MSIIDVLEQDKSKAGFTHLDVIEKVAEDRGWIFDRNSDDEITIQITGSWCNYSILFDWNNVMEAMFFTCTFDMRVPMEKMKQVYELIALFCEKMWLGHFCIWKEEGIPIFRHTLPLKGATGLSREQIEDIINTAVAECERFYPAFQYVVWGNKNAKDAISFAIIDTVGEA